MRDDTVVNGITFGLLAWLIIILFAFNPSPISGVAMAATLSVMVVRPLAACCCTSYDSKYLSEREKKEEREWMISGITFWASAIPIILLVGFITSLFVDLPA